MLIKNQLLIELPTFMQLAFSFLSIFKYSCHVAFMISVLLNYFNIGEIETTCKKTFLAILVYSFVTSFFVPVLDYVFELSDSIVGPHNYFLSDFSSTIGKYIGNTKFSVFGDQSYLNKLKENLVNPSLNFAMVAIINIMMFFIMGLLKLIYTIIYYIGTAILWIPLSIYILPGRDGFISGIINGFLWLIVVPILLAIYCKLGNEIISNSLSQSEIIGSTIEGTVFLMVMTCGMLGMEAFAFYIVNGSGVAAAGSMLAGIGTAKALDYAMKGTSVAIGASVGGFNGGVGGAVKGMSQSVSGKGIIGHISSLTESLIETNQDDRNENTQSGSFGGRGKNSSSLGSMLSKQNLPNRPTSMVNRSNYDVDSINKGDSFDPVTGEILEEDNGDSFSKNIIASNKNNSIHYQSQSNNSDDFNGNKNSNKMTSTNHKFSNVSNNLDSNLDSDVGEIKINNSNIESPVKVDSQTGEIKF